MARFPPPVFVILPRVPAAHQVDGQLWPGDQVGLSSRAHRASRLFCSFTNSSCNKFWCRSRPREVQQKPKCLSMVVVNTGKKSGGDSDSEQTQPNK